MFEKFEGKMRSAGMGDLAIATFHRYYETLVAGESGLVGEAEIGPVEGLACHEAAAERAEADAGLLGQTVVIKLNGGLGTSMGLRTAKSLLPVRGELTFLDLIVRQIAWLREQSGAGVRLLLMNSFATSGDSLARLEGMGEDGFANADEVELMQNQVPKIEADGLGPVAWPSKPDLEWCPPGHGDLYPALAGSGWLKRLLEAGVRYAFVSNSDNLGATLDPGLLQGFVESGAPFLMEVTRRTAVDRKGGHLARRRADGRLLLREVAQCCDGDMAAFQDVGLYRYFNTNNIWLRLDSLSDALDAHAGVLPLPVIRNRKTVDPRDKSSTPVIQLESAMGAAIECFDGAQAIEVPRSRFAPVKTTADLLGVRSDAYELGDDGRLSLVAERGGVPPVVELDDRYRLVDALDRLGLPSLRGCRRLVVDGEISFESGVVLGGEVSVCGSGLVKAGIYRNCEVKV